jgi:TRAP-type C4-dicarboxylate transport system permease small subunit
MGTSSPQDEERKPWAYAFAVLLIVSACMIILRVMSNPFLALDFEVSLVYLPTVLAGAIVLHLTRKHYAKD